MSLYVFFSFVWINELTNQKFRMTFFYFVNCCAMSYGPYMLLYKKSVLSEYQPYRVRRFSSFLNERQYFFIEHSRVKYFYCVVVKTEQANFDIWLFIAMYVDCVNLSNDNNCTNVFTWNTGSPCLSGLNRPWHFSITCWGHWSLWYLLCNQSNCWQTDYQGKYDENIVFIQIVVYFGT